MQRRTYKEIQEWIKKNYGHSVKTCWIAHVKEKCELIPVNPNRRYPCSTDKVGEIKTAFAYFKML